MPVTQRNRRAVAIEGSFRNYGAIWRAPGVTGIDASVFGSIPAEPERVSRSDSAPLRLTTVILVYKSTRMDAIPYKGFFIVVNVERDTENKLKVLSQIYQNPERAPGYA